MGGPTTYRVSTSNRTEAYPPGTPHVGLSNRTTAAAGPPPMQPPQAMIHLGDNPGPRLHGPAPPGAAILAERQRLEAAVAQLRAALADLYRLGQAQILLTPEREEILHRAGRALADTAPPTGA